MNDPATEVQPLDRYECLVCGYVYEPSKGSSKGDIAPGTPFEQLPSQWRCPVCGARHSQFKNLGPETNTSGFSENQRYGLGVNTLTPAQKNILIFGGLALGILFLLSLYGLQ